MARFNNKKVSVWDAPDAVNAAGGESFQESAELELVSLLLTSMVQDQFYRSAEQAVNRLETLVKALVGEGKAYFVAQAGLYARREFGLRSITHLLAGILSREVRGLGWTKDFYNTIVYRPDDMLEIMAIVLKTGNNIPNALKDGFARALHRLDGYRLSKYQGNNRTVKMVDVVNLTHPVATDPLTQLVRGNIAPADTWEVGLSAAGQKTKDPEEKSKLQMEVWTDLLLNNKLGYLALLRNIQNIAGVIKDKETLSLAIGRLTDEAAIKRSLVFPFQIHTAYEVMTGDIHSFGGRAEIDSIVRRECLKALERAAEISLGNIPKFEGATLIAMDLSISMTGGQVGTSSAAKVGGLFAAALWKSNPYADLMEFGSDAEYTNPRRLGDSLFNIAGYLAHSTHGGTNFHEIFRRAKKRYDRIIIISDMQAWEEFRTPKEAFWEYKKQFRANPKIYSMDLCGLGTLQFPESNVFALAGFSDKIFSVMELLETDRDALLNTIKRVDIRLEAKKLSAPRKQK